MKYIPVDDPEDDIGDDKKVLFLGEVGAAVRAHGRVVHHAPCVTVRVQRVVLLLLRVELLQLGELEVHVSERGYNDE